MLGPESGKVYVVMCDDEEGTRVAGVFADESKAQNWLFNLDHNDATYYIEDWRVKLTASDKFTILE